ncbi:RagB/SusD family nutrient uptake outer membrane protein [Marinoscillum furvescens]|uniref:Putative outer membrane starch-binding protein n=1 Tax=Marinoscillum furvescens DSM 4134 TaxID=1122208 RepID=A0A3D9L1V3_MARFU|nr:RagB/SusD family nutrient uptake outer membrane protein [Marinoscillum furvescens]RED98355.1 putative outer membrane starch-binding protein [Marinoscillum furvescens DSM 4134]
MNKYIYKSIFLLASVLMLSTGCEDTFDQALDRADDSRETLDGVLGDPDKVRGMLTAVYMGMQQDRTDLYFWSTQEALTDNAFDSQGQSIENWRTGQLSPQNAAAWVSKNAGNSYSNPNWSWWGRYWGAIRHCNTFIENFDAITVPEDDLPMSERELMLDEAIAMRAYFHFMLISYYGPLPFLDENPSVNFGGWSEMTRPTFQEITDKIVAELDEVISRGNIPMRRDPNSNDAYRIPMGFIHGLKTRVLLYNASPLNNPSNDPTKYQAAADAAKAFLDLGQYSLVDFEDLPSLYRSPFAQVMGSTEVIWASRSRANQLTNVHGMDGSTAVPKFSNFPAFKAGETPTQEAVDAYELSTGELVIEQYDPTHANPTFTAEALAAGYDDVNAPYANRDARFYKDIIFNTSDHFGESFGLGTIQVYTYFGAPGTGTNGNAVTGDRKKTYTGYYFGKDRNPIWYGEGSGSGSGNGRAYSHQLYMRIAEVYLNYAEALCGAGELELAADALDMTRVRAGQPPIRTVPGYQATQDYLMMRIRNERRVELMVEDSRFFDVRRWDVISDDQVNTISGMLVEQVSPGVYTHTRYQMPWLWLCHNEKYKVLPIPQQDKILLPAIDQPEAWQ